MQRILRIDEQLVSLAKQSIQPFDSVAIGTGDVLVVCAGFELRTLEVLRTAIRRGSGFKVLIIEYLPFYAENRIDELISICQESELQYERVTYDRRHPAGFGRMLLETLGVPTHRLFLDISGMSRLLIVQTIVAVVGSGQKLRECFITYTQAACYPPTRQEVESAILESDRDPMFAALFLSSGVFEVTIVPELSAASLGANQSRLVYFPSFNTYQLIALRQELQPSRYTYIHGVPPDDENRWRTDAIVRLNHIGNTISEAVSDTRLGCDIGSDTLAAVSKREEHFETSTLDYRETLDCLCRTYGNHGVRDRLLISPTGSKMQVVAVGLFRAFIEDVQIVYPTPRVFTEPKNYTTGIGPLHILPLAAFGDLASNASY